MSNPFRESILDVNLVELTYAIDVSDLLLLCLQHRQVLTPWQYGQILVRKDAVFSVLFTALCFKKVHPCDFRDNNAK